MPLRARQRTVSDEPDLQPGTELALHSSMASPQNTYVLDRRGAYQPAWLDDSDLDDDPPSPEWPFDGGPRASVGSELGPPHAEISTALPPLPRHGAAAAAMAITVAMITTFGFGWWVGRVPPPPEPTVARTVRSSAMALRAEAEMASPIVMIATAPEAAVPVWRSSPALAPLAPMPRVAPVAPPVTLVASDKPTETVAPVFVPTEL